MTQNEVPGFEAFYAMKARAMAAYKGEAMAMAAAARLCGCAPFDLDEAVALLIENGWNWNDVLNANS